MSRLVRLRDAATIEREQVDAAVIPPGSFYVGLENIEAGGRFVNVRSVQPGELASSKFRFTPQHVLYGKLRPYLAKIARPSFSGVCSTDILPLMPRSNVDRSYLAWTLLNPAIVARANSLATGANLPRISPQVLADLEIPLPELPEQRRIAEILDKADALRAKRRAGLVQLDTLTQSIFLDMFGDPLGEGWRMTTVAGIGAGGAAIRTGPFGSQLLHGEFVDDGVAVLGIDNAVENEFRWMRRRFITEAKYRKLSRYTVHPGDVLITLMGTCGRCAVVPDDVALAINTKHLCCITVDRTKCLPEFLHSYFLLHPIAQRYLRQTAKGAIMDGLNMGIIKEMPIPLPPLALQNRYTNLMRKLSEVKVESRQSALTLDALFASIQHRAFRGEL